MKKILLALALAFFIFSCGEDNESVVGNYDDTGCHDCEETTYDLAHQVEHALHHMDDDTAISIVADSSATGAITQDHIRYDISLKEKADSLYTGKITLTVDEDTDVLLFGNKAIKILLLDDAGNTVAFKDHQHVDTGSIIVTFIYSLTAGTHTFQLGPGPSADSTYSVVFEKYTNETTHEH